MKEIDRYLKENYELKEYSNGRNNLLVDVHYAGKIKSVPKELLERMLQSQSLVLATENEEELFYGQEEDGQNLYRYAYRCLRDSGWSQQELYVYQAFCYGVSEDLRARRILQLPEDIHHPFTTVSDMSLSCLEYTSDKKSCQKGIQLPWQEDRMQKALAPDSMNRICLYSHLGNIVALAAYYFPISGIAEITHVSVHPALRQIGIGSSLLARLKDDLHKRGYTAVRAFCQDDNDAAFLQKHGFHPYQPADAPAGWMLLPLIQSFGLERYDKRMGQLFVVWTQSPTGSGTPDLFWDMGRKGYFPLVDYICSDWYVGVMNGSRLLLKDRASSFFRRRAAEKLYKDIVYLTPMEVLNPRMRRIRRKRNV